MQMQRSWVSRSPNNMPTSVSSKTLSESEKLLIMEALDHIHVVRQYQEMGSCAACKKISLKKCSACGTFYCSSECQTFDWPHHRLRCSKPRDNSSDVSSFSSSKQMLVASSERYLNERRGDEKIIPMITNRGSPFTALANQLNKKSVKGFSDSKSFAGLKIGNAQYRNKEDFSKQLTNGLNDYKKVDPSKKSPRKPSSFRTSPTNSVRTLSGQTISGTAAQRNDSIANPKPADSISNSDGSSRKSSVSSRPETVGRMKVIGTCRESANRYWVMAVDNLDKYEAIQSTLNRECENYESIFPKLGFVCGCTYGDEWFRGKIMSMTPEISVHFIDVGNTSKYHLKIFKKIPYQLRSIPGLAFLIEFEECTPKKYKTEDLDSEKFTVEETGRTPDGAVRVRVMEGVYGGHQEPSVADSRRESSSARSALDVLNKTTTGMLFLVPGEGPTRYASMVADDDMESNDCIQKVLNIEAPKTETFQAAEGDYVLVQDNEGNDQRGKVISNFGSSYCVRLLDCGNVISTNRVYPLPEQVKSLVELGVKLTIEKVLMDDEMKQEVIYFSVEGDAVEGRWPCALRNQSRQVIAEVLLEKPTDLSLPETVHLKSGSTVEISHVVSPNTLYVRSVDGETEQKFLDMNMEMIQFATKGKHTPVPPFPGEMCCAKFLEDNCYYRAVIKAFDHVKVQVLFVDFGNEQETDLSDIKPLPEALKRMPFLAVKVTLKNVSSQPWNSKIQEYFRKLSSENVELTLTYTESIEDGVILREKVSGVVVNEFMEKGRTKSSSSDLIKEKGLFLEDDLKFTTPPPDGVCALAVLYINEREFEASHTFWATIADVDNFKYVNTELSLQISKHCESVSKPYRPTYRELCLAEYEGGWYRAMCAGCENDVFKVFFLDFGNASEVRAESIRQVKEEFVAAPALAMNCILNGHEKLKGKPELIKRIYEILLNRINTVITGAIVTPYEDDTFLTKVPEIEAILSE